MYESDMQQLLRLAPERLLDEEGLRFIQAEVGTAGKRLDLVFEDRHGRHVLVECQRGPLDTRHIDRHIEFLEGYQKEHPDVSVRLLYVAETIAPHQKDFLQKRGYEFREISERVYRDVAEAIGYRFDTLPPDNETDPDTGLEQQFHQAMVNIYRRAKTEVNYNASYFLNMVSQMGGLRAAKRLLASSEPQYGFTALWEAERLDLTVEALVLEPKYSTLFTEEERRTARARLEEYGYKFAE